MIYPRLTRWGINNNHHNNTRLMHFIIDREKEMSCSFGDYHPYDGHITINLALMDSPEELIITIIHEQLHELIDWGLDPHSSKEEEDHYIIPRLLC